MLAESAGLKVALFMMGIASTCLRSRSRLRALRDVGVKSASSYRIIVEREGVVVAGKTKITGLGESGRKSDMANCICRSVYNSTSTASLAHNSAADRSPLLANLERDLHKGTKFPGRASASPALRPTLGPGNAASQRRRKLPHWQRCLLTRCFAFPLPPAPAS